MYSLFCVKSHTTVLHPSIITSFIVQITSNHGQVLVNGVGEAAVGVAVEEEEETIAMELQQVVSRIV